MTVIVERVEAKEGKEITQSTQRERGEDCARHGRWELGVIEFLR
jgi:hypothetical protein